MDKILLFIPMYNCKKQIVRVLAQLDDSVAKYISQVIVVNNRSTDNGETAVIEYLEQNQLPVTVVLLRNNENYGLGGSHKVAFKYAAEHGFDYVIVLHGDDQGHIEDLIEILHKEEYKGLDSLLGARFLTGSRLEGYSAFRTLGNHVYNMLFSVVVKKKIFDLGSGLNMYKVDTLKSEYYLKFPDNLMFNYCMILAVDYYEQAIKFFPIRWSEEDQVSNVKMMNQALTVLGMLGKYAVGKKKFISKELREQPKHNYMAKQIYKKERQHHESEEI